MWPMPLSLRKKETPEGDYPNLGLTAQGGLKEREVTASSSNLQSSDQISLRDEFCKLLLVFRKGKTEMSWPVSRLAARQKM